MAKTLTKEDGSQWGYSIMDNTTGEMLNFVPVPIVNYGGPLATDDDTEWLATGPEYEKGLQLQIDMIQTDKTAPPLGTYVGHDIDKAFLDGKIAMQLSYGSFLQPLMVDYPDFQMGVAMPPAGPLNDLSLGGVGYWMMADASEAKPEAWALMEYLSSPEIATEYAQLSRLFASRTDINPFEGDALVRSVRRDPEELHAPAGAAVRLLDHRHARDRGIPERADLGRGRALRFGRAHQRTDRRRQLACPIE